MQREGNRVEPCREEVDPAEMPPRASPRQNAARKTPPQSPRTQPPPSPRGALPSPAAEQHAVADMGLSADSKGKREKRVRSATRKRGSRGQGGKAKHKSKEAAKKKMLAGARPAISPAAPTIMSFQSNMPPLSMQPVGMPMQPLGVLPSFVPLPTTPQSPPKKRKRERKNRNWKPWSEQTWEERLEREKYQERKAAQRAAQESLPLSKNKKKKHKHEFVMPRAPRNTTQALMNGHGGAVSDTQYNQNGNMEPTSMPSMEGLLSRQSIADRQWARDDNESSDSEDDPSASRPRTPTHPHANGAAAACPPSHPCSRSAMSLPSPPNCSEMDAMKTAAASAHEKDRRIRELETQNELLRARLAAVEATAAAATAAANRGSPTKALGIL